MRVNDITGDIIVVLFDDDEDGADVWVKVSVVGVPGVPGASSDGMHSINQNNDRKLTYKRNYSNNNNQN